MTWQLGALAHAAVAVGPSGPVASGWSCEAGVAGIVVLIHSPYLAGHKINSIMKILIGEYSVLEQGTLIIEEDVPVRFFVEELSFDLVIQTDTNNPEQRMSFETINDKMHATLHAINFNSVGTGPANPILLGTLGDTDELEFFLIFRVSLFAGTSRVINYNWLTKPQVS